MKAVVWEDEGLGAKFQDEAIPTELAERAAEARLEMIEACVDLDEAAMEAYLSGEEIDNDTIKRLLRKAVITGAFFPVLCGSAFKNKGVQPLLDAVVDFLPSPVDVPPIVGIDPRKSEETLIERPAKDDAPFAALGF